MPDLEFVNHNSHTIQIKGPDGQGITFRKLEKKVLPAWFQKYTPRYLTVVGQVGQTSKKRIKIKEKIKHDNQANMQATRQRIQSLREKRRRVTVAAKKPAGSRRKSASIIDAPTTRRKIVGGRKFTNSKQATQFFQQIIKLSEINISNDIGIGILSYNRMACIRRLIESIRRHTDLSRVCIFVSDESSDRSIKSWLSKQEDITFINNDERLGVAGNTNRLLRCLARFKYKILLNDDVQIAKKGWENIYVAAMKETGYHHFCMRQRGIYGAKDRDGKVIALKGLGIQTITEKPHGAVIAFDDIAFDKVGYFDESFGTYGMEHVDWSNRVSLSEIQPNGFHDVIGSEQFFIIHKESSAVSSTDRSIAFRQAKEKYAQVSKNKRRIYVDPTDKSRVEGVSYIVPFRGKDRLEALDAVIGNVRSQNFPVIEIILAEQSDHRTKELADRKTIIYALAESGKAGQPFCKSAACNLGVSKASHNIIILHDADMLVDRSYTNKVCGVLKDYDACHLGRSVTYLNSKSTTYVVKSGKVSDSLTADLVVNYFEGGSLACKRRTYFDIGGFNEQFIGYGVEDCEFFERLSKLTNFYDHRSVNLIHMFHGRTRGWQLRHRKNKDIYSALGKHPMQERRDALIKKLKSNGYKKILRDLKIK